MLPVAANGLNPRSTEVLPEAVPSNSWIGISSIVAQQALEMAAAMVIRSEVRLSRTERQAIAAVKGLSSLCADPGLRAAASAFDALLQKDEPVPALKRKAGAAPAP